MTRGLLDGDVEMSFYLPLGLSPVVMKGCHFSQVGGMMVTRGYYTNLAELRGHTPPPNMWSKGGIL